VILRGPSNAGWHPTVVTTANASITVRMCNFTGVNANPNGQTIAFLAIR
jgi:hypothetical protein